MHNEPMTMIVKNAWRGGVDLWVKTRGLRAGRFHFATRAEAQRIERLFLRLSGAAPRASRASSHLRAEPLHAPHSPESLA